MKFPEGGGTFLRDFVWLRNRLFARATRFQRTEGGLEARRAAPSEKLFAQLELFRDRLVTAQIGVLQVIKEAAALADHHEQSATGAVILLVALQMLGQMVDPLREQRDLHIGGTGVLRVRLKLFNRLYLRFHKLNE
jgi:hypothetical protein